MTYEAVKRIRLNPTSEDCDNEELSKMIDTAIEKQIPKKCKKFKDICSCGYGVYPHMNYCSNCGQALDWKGNPDGKD